MICPAHRMDAKEAEWLLRHGVTRSTEYAAAGCVCGKQEEDKRRDAEPSGQSIIKKRIANKSKQTNKSKENLFLFSLRNRKTKKRKRKRKNPPSDLDRFLCRIGTSALLSAYLRR